jgi:hypothetical protein
MKTGARPISIPEVAPAPRVPLPGAVQSDGKAHPVQTLIPPATVSPARIRSVLRLIQP